MMKQQKEVVELFLSKGKLRQVLFQYAFGLPLLIVMIIITISLWYSSHKVSLYFLLGVASILIICIVLLISWSKVKSAFFFLKNDIALFKFDHQCFYYYNKGKLNLISWEYIKAVQVKDEDKLLYLGIYFNENGIKEYKQECFLFDINELDITKEDMKDLLLSYPPSSFKASKGDWKG